VAPSGVKGQSPWWRVWGAKPSKIGGRGRGPQKLKSCGYVIANGDSIFAVDELRATVSVGLIVSSPHVGYTALAVFFGAQYGYGVRCILDISRRRCYKLPRAARRGAARRSTGRDRTLPRRGTRRGLVFKE